MSPEDFVSHEALFSSICTFSAHVVFHFEEFFFTFIIFLGNDDPRSRSVSAAEFLAGCILAVIWVSIVIDGEVNPRDGFGQWCYRDWHNFGAGGKGVIDL